jgi:hypothetical protein
MKPRPRNLNGSRQGNLVGGSPMDRKDFLRSMLRGGVGLCCCGAVLGGIARAQSGEPGSPEGPGAQPWIGDLERRMIRGAESPDWRRLEKSVEWIKDLMSNMDSMLDEKTRVALMQACGRSCYEHAFGVASEVTPSADAAARFIQALEGAGYEVQRAEGTTLVNFSWGRGHQNPQGLIIQDGYCMCPIVEPIVTGLSATYCSCSAGYVREYFERYLGKPVKVEIVETLQTGGTDCRFKIEIPNL